MAHRVGPKGQVVIPKELRDELGNREAELWTGDPELLVTGALWRWRDLRSSGQ